MNQEKPPFKAGSFILLLVATFFIPLIGIIVGAINIKSPNRNGQSGALMGLGIIMFLWAFIGGLGGMTGDGSNFEPSPVSDVGEPEPPVGERPSEPRQSPRQVMVTCSLCQGNGVCYICSGSGEGPYGNPFCPSCYGNGVCDFCEGEGRYPENTDLAADAFNYVTKKGLCNTCRATGRCSFCGGVERPAWLGPCIGCRGTNVCSICQGKKYVDVRDKGVKARE